MTTLARSCLGYLLLVLWPAAAVEIYTAGTVEALNGTDVRLKCTFSSRESLGPQLIVTWNFQPQEESPTEFKRPTEFVFHYQEKPYPTTKGRFSGRVTWDGNIARKDASIMISNVNPQDNGTFHCQVKNPPDVDGGAGEVRLKVVLKVSFSEIHLLAIIIGAACALMIVVVIAVVVCRHRRKMQQDRSVEMVERKPAEKEKLADATQKSKMSQEGVEY